MAKKVLCVFALLLCMDTKLPCVTGHDGKQKPTPNSPQSSHELTSKLLGGDPSLTSISPNTPQTRNRSNALKKDDPRRLKPVPPAYNATNDQRQLEIDALHRPKAGPDLTNIEILNSDKAPSSEQVLKVLQERATMSGGNPDIPGLIKEQLSRQQEQRSPKPSTHSSVSPSSSVATAVAPRNPLFNVEALNAPVKTFREMATDTYLKSANIEKINASLKVNDFANATKAINEHFNYQTLQQNIKNALGRLAPDMGRSFTENSLKDPEQLSPKDKQEYLETSNSILQKELARLEAWEKYMGKKMTSIKTVPNNPDAKAAKRFADAITQAKTNVTTTIKLNENDLEEMYAAPKRRQ